jgi:hypothetical protein
MSAVSFLLGALVGGAAGAGGYYLYTQSQTAGATASSSASTAPTTSTGATAGTGAPLASRAWPEGYTPAGTAAPLLARGLPEGSQFPPAEDTAIRTGTAAPRRRAAPLPTHANPQARKPQVPVLAPSYQSPPQLPVAPPLQGFNTWTGGGSTTQLAPVSPPHQRGFGQLNPQLG